jgi:glycosyltransferase involved in cell wall biosynthesis
MEKVSVIIPAYNEAGHIEKSIKEVVSVFDDFKYNYEIIIVDDGSRDNTYEEAKRSTNKYKHVFVKRNLRNYGKGRALKKGVRFASGNYIVLLDADMELHPSQIQTFFDIMKLDEVDVVIGSKMHPNSKVFYPLHRKIISSIYYAIIWVLFDLPTKDTQTGIKLFKSEVLKKAFPKILIKKFAYDIELLAVAHRMGYKIADAPVKLDSKFRWGRVGFRAIFDTWWDTMAIWYRMYMLHWYDRK